MSKTERRRRTRVKSVAESPLDDAPRLGPELWREIDGVRFCHWDRWLLRLALTEPQGLAFIAQEFRRRAQNERRPDRTAEALGPYAEKLHTTVGQDCRDWRGTGAVVTLLDVTARELLFCARSTTERLAIHRAVLAIAIEAMERIDDSLGEMAELFREYEAAYLALILGDADNAGPLRDLVEIVVWEDYGLFTGIPGFFRRLSEPRADRVMCELGRIAAELRGAGLHYQLAKARGLRQELIAAAVTTFLSEPDREGPAPGCAARR